MIDLRNISRRRFLELGGAAGVSLGGDSSRWANSAVLREPQADDRHRRQNRHRSL